MMAAVIVSAFDAPSYAAEPSRFLIALLLD
jgi:hypothetical protein